MPNRKLTEAEQESLNKAVLGHIGYVRKDREQSGSSLSKVISIQNSNLDLGSHCSSPFVGVTVFWADIDKPSPLRFEPNETGWYCSIGLDG